MGLTRLQWTVICIIVCTLITNTRTQNIVEKLKEIEHSSVQVNTGSASFSRIRDDDRAASDLAFKLLKVAWSSPAGLDIRSGGESEFSLNDIDNDQIAAICPYTNSRKPRCNPSDKFRTVDGSCNNMKNPLWGMSSTPFNRITLSEYSSKGYPRLAKSGKELPSPRLLSQEVLGTSGKETTLGISTFFVQMGQFIDHDLTLTPEEEHPCCAMDSKGRPWKFPESFNKDQCIPIKVPDNDRIWGPRGRTCIEARRSSVALNLPKCQGKLVREQFNAITHWLDASNVYGSSIKEARDVRDGDSIFLKTFVPSTSRSGRQAARTGRSLLPPCIKYRNRINACLGPCENTDNNCKVAGDQRVNEQPGLTTSHTIWLREHNRIATALESINNHWDEERVFQEARRVLIAEWQHIVYNEWLPIVLGNDYMNKFKMFPRKSGYSTSYNENLDPRINNEFATAAFRFGHSMMPTNIPSRDKTLKQNRFLTLHQVFQNASLFETEENLVDDILRGQVGEPAAAWDPSFNEDLVNKLFDEEADLMALNINRGRDHGLPGYNTYREVCQAGSGKVRSFQELAGDKLLSSDDINLLKAEYDDVEDIDLFVGGTMEENHSDSLLGPVFTCIIGDAFQRLQEGDRFYYENGDDPQTRFNIDQLNAIRENVSMARIICDNSDVEEIQPRVFRTEDVRDNKMVNCKDTTKIPKLDSRIFYDSK